MGSKPKYRIVKIAEKKYKVQKKGLIYGWNDVKRRYPRAKVTHTIIFDTELKALRYIESIT